MGCHHQREPESLRRTSRTRCRSRQSCRRHRRRIRCGRPLAHGPHPWKGRMSRWCTRYHRPPEPEVPRCRNPWCYRWTRTSRRSLRRTVCLEPPVYEQRQSRQSTSRRCTDLRRQPAGGRPQRRSPRRCSSTRSYTQSRRRTACRLPPACGLRQSRGYTSPLCMGCCRRPKRERPPRRSPWRRTWRPLRKRCQLRTECPRQPARG